MQLPKIVRWGACTPFTAPYIYTHCSLKCGEGVPLERGLVLGLLSQSSGQQPKFSFAAREIPADYCGYSVSVCCLTTS